MNDIFSNASVTQNKYSEGLKDEKHHTFKCKNCGAPRLEEMQYDNCLFCGSVLFETK
jgi:rRNA maturation endonuclease Nob1